MIPLTPEQFYEFAQIWEDGVREMVDEMQTARARGDELGAAYAEGAAKSLGCAAKMLRTIGMAFEEEAA